MEYVLALQRHCGVVNILRIERSQANGAIWVEEVCRHPSVRTVDALLNREGYVSRLVAAVGLMYCYAVGLQLCTRAAASTPCARRLLLRMCVI